MAYTFEIPNANPIRLIKQTAASGYLLLPFDLAYTQKCYYQKYTLEDVVILQYLSDIEDVTFKVFDLFTNELKYEFFPVEVSTSIIGQTFKCYEIEIQFDAEGDYYCELSYEDPDTTDEILYQSEPISVKELHEKTILIEYTNSENNFSVIFETGVVFRLRVEGTIAEFTPEYEEIVYNDQQKNATKLYAVPFRSFKLYIGNAEGVPDWLIDRVNYALVCDSVKIEGVYYERKEGSKWEANRADPDGTPFVGWSTDIIPVENLLLQRFKTGEQPPEGFTVVEKVKNYFANAGDRALSGLFRKYSRLNNIGIINYGDPFDITIGTTPGGDDIGVWNIPSGIPSYAKNISIHYLFTAVGTIYLTGLEDTDTDILVDYLQFDELPTAGMDVPVAPSFPVGFQGTYYPIIDRPLETDFNLGTGLGMVGTPYANCAICDGRNGTPDMRGRFIMSYDDTQIEYSEIGNTGGIDQFVIEQGNLPSGYIKLPIKPTGGDWRTSGGSGTPTTPAATSDPSALEISLGNDEPIDFVPKYIVALPFLAIS